MALNGDHVDHLYLAPPYQDSAIRGTLMAMAKELRPGGLTLWTSSATPERGGFMKPGVRRFGVH